MASLGDMIVRVGADVGDFVGGMQQVNRELSATKKAIDEQTAGLKSFGSAMTSMGVQLSAAITAPLVGVGAAAVSAAGSLEQAQIAFTTMLGSAERASGLLQALQEFAAKTPFQFDQLVKASQMLMAYQFRAEELLPVLRAVGDAAAALGGGPETIERIVRALGQMKAKGVVSAEEIRQLAEAGIPAWQMLAEAIGVTVPEAMKLAEKRAISAAEAIPALLAGMNAKFAGMMEQQSQTMLGRWSTFRDEMENALRAVGSALLPFAKQATELLIGLADKIKAAAEWFSKLPDPIQKTVIVGAALAAAIGPLLIVIGQLATSVAAVMSVWPAMTAAFSAAGPVIGAVASPIGLVVAALAALAIWAATHWEQVRAVLLQAWEGLTEYWAAQWNGAKQQVLAIWDGISKAAQAVWGVIGPWLTVLWDGVVSAWQSVWGTIGPWLTGTWQGIRNVLVAVWDSIASAAQAVWGAVTAAIQKFVNYLKSLPGFEKLLSLDKAWADAGKLEEQTKKTTKAVMDFGSSTSAAGKQVTIAAQNVSGLAKQQAEAEKTAAKMRAELAKNQTEALRTSIEWQGMTKALREQMQAYDEARRFLIEYHARMLQGKDTTWAMEQAVTSFEQALQDASRAMGDANQQMLTLSKSTMPSLVSAAAQAEKAADQVSNAWKTLGLPSPSEREARQKEIQQAYEAIKNSGLYSADEVQKAYEAMLKKTGATAESTSKQIMQSVSTAITNFTQSIAKTLWEGPGNFGDKVKDIFRDLGESITTLLLEKWTAKITEWAADTLTGLLAKVFGNALSNAAASAIGAGTSAAAGAAGSAAGGAAAAGAAGTAGAVAAGIGALGASLIGGVVSGGIAFAGSIIGAKMLSGDLGNIEENTRYTAIALIGSQGVIDLQWAQLDRMWELRDLLMGIDSKLGWLWEKVDVSLTGIMDRLAEIRDRIVELPEKIVEAGGRAISITIQGNVIGNDDFVDYLAKELARRAV